ncbi:MAG TPA: META domain-containing protein [Paracoccaceae bacterium]|nr:META domain-containing protein [Paracoccaceae bacterium]
MHRFLAAALLTGAVAAPALARDLSGEVAYRERIALPPGAEVVVSAWGREGLAGTAVIPTDGRQVPLPWEMPGLPDGPLVVLAAIRDGDGVRWLGQPVAVAEGETTVPPMVLAAHVPAGFATTLFCGPSVVRLGFGAGGAVLTYGGEGRVLAQVVTASGAKFADGKPEDAETSVWTKGEGAKVLWSGGEMPPCRSAALPPEAPMVARGNEPFWRLDLTAEGLVLTTPEGEEARTGTLPPPVFGTQSVVYTVPGGPEISLYPETCSDTMTGMPYPMTVILRADTAEERRMGCGGEPRDLLQGNWTAVELDGSPLPAGAEVTLSFEGDRVAGRAACNRYTGGIILSGEGLSFGPAAGTRMACAPDLMAVEAAFFAALPAIDRFEVDGAGDLLLIGADRTRLRARR